jgi:spore maturation protein CgeB
VARGQLAEFERAGVKRAAYLAEAHDPELHYPVETAAPEFRSEVAFIGKYGRDSHLHATRGALIPPVAARFDLKLYGSGWHELGLSAARGEVFPEQYRQICRGAGIVLGCDWRHDVQWYFSNRTWFTLGSRGFLLTNYAPGLEDLFENHRHLVWYRSVDECLELIEHYRARPDERARIAAEGRAFARAHRTYDDFARDLVDLVEGRTPQFPPRQRAS